MLGKLIKHEFKATWKMVALMNIFLLVLTALGVLSFAFKFWNVSVKFQNIRSLKCGFFMFNKLIFYR